MREIFRNLLTLISLLPMLSCNSQGQQQDFDYGTYENGVYSNRYFNLQLSVPTDWVVQTKEQMTDLMKEGGELVAGDDKNLRAALKASEVNVANLLYASQFEKGSAVEYNPSFLMNAENVKTSPGIKVGKDYLFQVRRILEQSQLKYNYIDKEFSRETIGGKDFYIMKAEISYLGLDIKQIYYCTIQNGFSLNIIISFISQEQKDLLLKSIRSLKKKT